MIVRAGDFWLDQFHNSLRFVVRELEHERFMTLEMETTKFVQWKNSAPEHCKWKLLISLDGRQP